jgi:hypothetical protein
MEPFHTFLSWQETKCLIFCKQEHYCSSGAFLVAPASYYTILNIKVVYFFLFFNATGYHKHCIGVIIFIHPHPLKRIVLYLKMCVWTSACKDVFICTLWELDSIKKKFRPIELPVTSEPRVMEVWSLEF